MAKGALSSVLVIFSSSTAADARNAADQAKAAGERAAEDVLIRLRKLFLKMAKDITEELGDVKK